MKGIVAAFAVVWWVLAAAPAYGADCNAGNGGITVPAGFCARVYVRNVGALRQLAVGPRGTVYAALSRDKDGYGIAVLRGRNSDGTAGSIRYVGAHVVGTGIRVHDGYLYFGENDRIVRFAIDPGTRLPHGPLQVVVGGFPEQHEHAAKSFAFDQAGHLYVNVGAPSNACQQEDRALHSPGIDPCPLLRNHGGIWRFAAERTGQRFGAPHRYATGLRNDVALAWNLRADALYAVMMGRDQLHEDWPDLFSAQQSAELPAEELLRVVRGGNYGWPYCYYDGQQRKLVLAPEYGGDGTRQGRCTAYRGPLVAFPAHWAPEQIVFYRAKSFPARYRGGAFIAFHGSWNRAPLPQQGFVVGFVPFRDGKPSGQWTRFATGFAGAKRVLSPHDARFRPVGAAVGPQGALYIADSQRGWIWRITWEGRSVD